MNKWTKSANIRRIATSLPVPLALLAGANLADNLALGIVLGAAAIILDVGCYVIWTSPKAAS